MVNKVNILLLITSVLLLGACSSTKYLKPGEVLYTGADVKINPDSAKKVKGEKDLRETLTGLTRPVPNKTFLGIRYKLFFYNLAGEPKKEKGFRHWLRNKLGEPPVLMNQVDINSNVRVLQSYLMSKGYLQAYGDGEKVVKDKKGKAVYRMFTHERYTINNITFPVVDTNYEITSIINDKNDKTLLKKDKFYDLDVFKAERVRIDNDLKESGYYYFSPDYILMQVDSTVGNYQVDVYLKLKDETPMAALKPYYIRNINIYPNYTLDRDSVIRIGEPVQFKDFSIYDPYNTYKPRLFERLIFFEKGEKYNRKDHALSLNRLVNIGTFKFVKAEFTPLDTLSSNNMDVDFILTSLKRKALTFEVAGISKSNNFVGSEVKLSHINRNTFKGAEQLRITLSGGFEKQVSGQHGNANSYSLGAEARLTFPRFVFPIWDFDSYNAFVPKTHITIGAQMMNRARYYTLLSGTGEFGYIWKGNQYNEHEFNPLSISYIKTTNTTDSFARMLERLPMLKRNFENQFIIGTNYTYTYTNQFQDYRRNNILFIGSAESAGNLINLFLPTDADGKKRLFNTVTNQYLRLEADFRDYYKLKRNKTTLAGRMNIGYGIPHGNSENLPYVRQFFAGGGNDIRAFRARSLGPGTFNVNRDTLQLFADQGGDIKFLTSAELRAKIYRFIHGAVFLDAGNIWLAREDSTRPGGKFNFGRAFSEIAVGGGVGLRIDVNILVVRADLAMPLRKPYEPAGSRWVFNQIKFGDPQWRRDNLILNLGIGYPF